jgi:hypothetical protein
MQILSLIDATSVRSCLCRSFQRTMKTLRKVLSRVRVHRRGKAPVEKPSIQALEGLRGLEKVISTPSTAQASGNGPPSPQLAGDLPDAVSAPTPSAVSAETLLVSWLITLLRTREDGEASYEWAYCTRVHDGAGVPETVVRLSAKEVMPSLESEVEQVAAAISRHMARASPTLRPDQASPASLLFSSGSLSRGHESSDKDEVSAVPCSAYIPTSLTETKAFDSPGSAPG